MLKTAIREDGEVDGRGSGPGWCCGLPLLHVIAPAVFTGLTAHAHRWQVLLRLRLLACGVAHSRDHVCRDHHRHVLLPIVCGGLPLVVAVVPHGGLLGGALG